MLAHRFRFSFHLFKFFHFCRFIYSGDGGVCMLSVFYLVEVEALSDCIVFHSIFVSSVYVLFASSNWHTVLGSWQFIFFCLTLIFHVFHTFYFSCRRRMFYDIYCELLRNRARKFGIKIRNKNKTIFLDVVYVFFFSLSLNLYRRAARAHSFQQFSIFSLLICFPLFHPTYDDVDFSLEGCMHLYVIHSMSVFSFYLLASAFSGFRRGKNGNFHILVHNETILHNTPALFGGPFFAHLPHILL